MPVNALLVFKFFAGGSFRLHLGKKLTYF